LYDSEQDGSTETLLLELLVSGDAQLLDTKADIITQQRASW